MRTVVLPSGERVPVLGQGTWKMAEDRKQREEEIASLRLGLDLGLTLIDTAEMYAEGRAEELVAEAIGVRRNEVFIVSKVYPHNASRTGAIAACERSLKRLRTDRIDLYLLHWRGDVPLAETMEAFMALQRVGKVRHYGVSNLDLTDMQELFTISGGSGIVTNQVLYNVMRRGIEWDLLPWQRERNISTMAYSPMEQGRLLRNRKLIDFSKRHDMTPAQAALSWLLAKDDVIVIPKTGNSQRVTENAGAVSRPLTQAQLDELDELFPPPTYSRPLEMN